MICPTCHESMLTEHPHKHPGRQGYDDDRAYPTQVRHDRQREALEADMAKQREAHRQEHIAIVAKALGRDRPMLATDAFELAAVAVDALLADGVVFARFNRSDEEE